MPVYQALSTYSRIFRRKYKVKRGEYTVTYGLYKQQWGKCMKSVCVK